uniref:Acyl-CoA Delta(11) desaturase n=1 Tax=Cacopsylla melanoneura TaxID=428564 RepID=A0A8D8PU65_9HEMI
MSTIDYSHGLYRVHHKFSDTDADPHNANRGFFFSHIGWLMCKKHPEVIAKGNQLDLSDLFADPLVRYYQKAFIYFRAFLCFIIPPCMATYLWGEDIIVSFITLSFIRYVLSLNFTFLVNSAAHLYGYKPYDTRIFPSQNKWVSLVAMGEGWHNYHHVFPWDYRAAEFGTYSLNITTLWLDLFARIGWAYDMKKPSEKMVRAHAVKYAGVEHPHEVNEEEAMELESEEDKMTAFDYIKNKPSVENANVEDKPIEQISNVETVVKSKSVEEDIHPTVQKRHIKNMNDIASNNNDSIEPISDSDRTTKNKSVEQMNGFESIINNKTGDFINSFHTMMKNNPAVEPMSGFDSLIMTGGILIKDKAA